MQTRSLAYGMLKAPVCGCASDGKKGSGINSMLWHSRKNANMPAAWQCRTALRIRQEPGERAACCEINN